MDPTAAPGGAPPPLPPNFYDAKPWVNHRGALIGISVTFMVLLWITLTIRLYIRFIIARAPGWDDVFIVLAAAHVTMGAIATCIAPTYGLGDHIYLLTPDQITGFLKMRYILGASYVGSTAYIKISLLFQYLRIFEKGTKIYRITQFTLIIIGLWGFAFIFMNWFGCFPTPAASWDGTNKGCYASFSADIGTAVRSIEAQGGSNMIWDFIVLGIAFRLLFEKDGPVNRKGLLVLLTMGLVASSFGIWRFAILVKSQAGSSSMDVTWIYPGPQLLSIVEVCIACLCATTPFFWPVIQEALSKIFVSYEFKVVSESRWDDGNNGEDMGHPTNVAVSQYVPESHYELTKTASPTISAPTEEYPSETRSIHKQWGSYGGSSYGGDLMAEDSRAVSPVLSSRTAETRHFIIER